jgi:amino acid efflux transporter
MEKRTRLHASIGLPQAIALYIGAVLGSGVLLVPGLAAEIAGPASLLAWGFMAVFVLPMALSMGLLAAKFPHAGGVSHFVTKAFGNKAGTCTGWFFLMSVPIGAPVAALTGAGYLCAAMGWGQNVQLAIAIVIVVIGLLTNLVGMKIAGQIQIAVVASIIAVLVTAILGAMPHMKAANFTPFLPHGWIRVGQAAAILYWCFIGWEAVSHLSEEFIDPEREAIRGVTIASFIVSALYFLTALATVGTHSYGNETSGAALVLVIEQIFGTGGALIAGMTGVFICTATIIAYIGAASRLAYSLAQSGNAPRMFAVLSQKYGTPLGGIVFLGICFAIVFLLYGSGCVSLTTLIQLPNATFILTYLAGCAAGTRLLKGHPWGVWISWLSFLLTAAIFPFVGWAILYPLLIVIGLVLANRRASKRKA